MVLKTPPMTLMEALDFSPDDVAANREGRVSERQQAKLRAARRRSVYVGAAILIAVGLAATVLLFLGERNESAILTFVGISVTVCNAVIMSMIVRNWLRLTADIDSGQVTALEGEVHHTIRVTGRMANYLIRLQGQEVVVSKPAFLAIREGAPYRVYRTPAAKTLLSIEAVDTENGG